MTKTKEEFIWKFHIPDISLVFKHISDGSLIRIDGLNNVYECREDCHKLAETLQSENLIQVYTPDVEAVQSPEKKYAVEDGRFVLYESKPAMKKGELSWKEIVTPVTDNFYLTLNEDITFDNGIEKIHKWVGKIFTKGGLTFDFDINATTFANMNELSSTLINIAGSKVRFDNNKFKDIRNAMIELSINCKSIKVSQVFGWENVNVYHSPSSMMMRGAVIDNKGEGKVDLSDVAIAKHLDILPISKEDFKRVGEHIFSDLLYVHERYPMDCLVGHTFMAPIANYVVEHKRYNGGRIGMWLVGGSGCGKTYAAMLFQNFFGSFGGSKPAFSWLGTPYSIQEGGYYFKDALFMVDDFKIAHFSKSALDSVVMVLQNYADGTSRTRLSGNMELSEGKPIRGSILITGEDVLDDVGSVMGRYHVVHMNDKFKNRDAGKKAREFKHLYSGFMGKYIAWLTIDRQRVIKIVKRIENMKDVFVGERTGANIDRVGQSFAYNLVGFETFCQFSLESELISTEKCKEMIETHRNNLFGKIDDHVSAVREATVSEIFISTLCDLINSGSVKIFDALEGKKDVKMYEKYGGFDTDDEFIYFFGVQVLDAVNTSLKASTGRGLSNSKNNLIDELVRRGIMSPGTQGNTYNKKFFGKTISTWRIYKSALGYENRHALERFTDGEEDNVEDISW